MSHQPSEQDGRRGLRDHALEKAALALARYGPVIDAAAILRVLDDRDVVRYPTLVRFDATGLQPGEFAHAEPLGEHPRDGFCLYVHPSFARRDDVLPLLVAYHIPPINYGDIVEPEDCEAFGAALLAMSPEDYYDELCELADSLEHA